jgi:hypothetical protein
MTQDEVNAFLDVSTRKARVREAAFWDWYNKTEPYLHLYNTRMIFDLAYDTGYEVGVAQGEEYERERLANPIIDEGDTRDIEPEPEELEEGKCVCGVGIDIDYDLCSTCAYPRVETNPRVYADEYQAEINSDGYINYLNNKNN